MEELNFVIRGKHYTTKPTKVGSIIDLWKLRTALSMGTYGQMYRMGLENADNALLMIDIEAFFTVFCPEFIDNIKPVQIRELGIVDYVELRDLYQEEILPWLTSVEDLLKKKDEKDNV